MYEIENIAYLPLDINSPPKDCIKNLENINLNMILRDEYRNCWHIPLMLQNENSFNWTEFSDLIPELKNWCTEEILSITGLTRIMIIVTPPGQTNPPHIDCSPKKFKSLQHKIRYVLQGNIDDLIFITSDGDLRINSPIDKPFIMSGKWPHYMHNTSKNFKFTFALGSPWDSDLNNIEYFNLVSRSIKKYSQNIVSIKSKKLPYNYKSLFEEKYLNETK